MSARTRRYALLWHRYAGLFMAVFLAIAGLTGSILAFRQEIDRWLSPQLYAPVRAGVPPLDLVTLAQRAQGLVPHARVSGVNRLVPDQAQVLFTPDKDPATGKRYPLGFSVFLVDPWTGRELGRRNGDDISKGRQNLPSFLLHLHDSLLSAPGFVFMGVIALVWTIDCFIAVYLTMPPMLRRFWRQWQPAWQIERGLGAYRLNLDLHRAFGLWLWPIMFVFAWSSVMFNLRYPVYDYVMRSVFDYESQIQIILGLTRNGRMNRNAEMPIDVDWRQAETTGRAMLEARGRERGFTVGESTTLVYLPPFDVFSYGARTSKDIRRTDAGAAVMFDRSGKALLVLTPSGDHVGNTVESWLSALHTADVFGRWYQWFVALLGVVITMFSATGVYLWWKKRRVRRARRRRFLARRAGGAA
ncbi:MAG: PepSY-associated TM helix domain-containing protein [Vicinamibacterales bacterium]